MSVPASLSSASTVPIRAGPLEKELSGKLDTLVYIGARLLSVPVGLADQLLSFPRV